MNYCEIHQNNAFATVSISDRKGPLVCPKPRQVGLVIKNPMRTFRCHVSHQAEVFDSKAGAELLDIILKKEGFGVEQSATQFASLPPFFSGSPPSRAAEKVTHLSALPSPSPLEFGFIISVFIIL